MTIQWLSTLGVPTSPWHTIIDIVCCIWDEMYCISEGPCVICFSTRFHMTSQDLSQETRTPFLRISCLQWSVSTQWITCIWAHCGVRAHLMHSSQPTAHKTTLSKCHYVCIYVCFITYTADSTVCVCILSMEGARCGVLWLAGHRQALCGCQASLTSSSLIAIIPMMKLII